MDIRTNEIEQDQPGSDSSPSAFDPDVAGQVMIIQLARLYDVTFALLAEQNPDKAKQIAQLHSRGGILSPPPSLILDE